MSIALIEESAKEVRRLAIAGSRLSAGDFRMKRLIGPLEQAGAKVPVFAQVAKAISELVNGTEADSAERLLTLSTLLNAILYTQGQSDAEGNFTELEEFATNCCSTRTSARALKPLIAALTSTGSGRFETVKSACDRAAFNDLRLIDPAIRALGDNYSEIADLVADKVLPGYGPGIVPRLRASFDIHGNKPDARKLKVMHQLDPHLTASLCKTALEEGTPEVKAAAIACLGKHDDCFQLVMDQVNAKNKTVRAAALEALAEHDRPEVVKIFGEVIKSKTLDILTRPFRAIRSRQVVNSMLEEGKRVFSLVLKGEADHIQRFSEILECLKLRNEPQIEEFLLSCFGESEKLGRFKAPKSSQFTPILTGADLMDRLAWLLYSIGSPRALDAVLTKREKLPPSSFTLVLQSALRIWPADRIYEEFSPLMDQKKTGDKEKLEVLQHLFRISCGGYVSDPEVLKRSDDTSQAQNTTKVQWDPRWLDAAIKSDQQLIVCSLAKPGHSACVTYLLSAIGTKSQSAGLLVRALLTCGYPKVTETFLDLVAKKTQGARYVDYDLQLLFETARHLPPTDLPRLDAFAATLEEKFVDKYLEALEPLRRPNPLDQG